MTEYYLRPRNEQGITHSYWANWTDCSDDYMQDLAQWNAELVFDMHAPTRIVFETEQDMVAFILRWS